MTYEECDMEKEIKNALRGKLNDVAEAVHTLDLENTEEPYPMNSDFSEGYYRALEDATKIIMCFNRIIRGNV